jgi:hypothetical protein
MLCFVLFLFIFYFVYINPVLNDHYSLKCSNLYYVFLIADIRQFSYFDHLEYIIVSVALHILGA